MAARAASTRLSTARILGYSIPTATRRASIAISTRKLHSSPSCRNTPQGQSKTPRSDAPNPIAASMAKSTSPSGNDTAATSDDSKNAAFLGEADSDDAFEADMEINPEAHRHKFDDVGASGLHGQAGEGDEPIERERKPHEALDASQAAFLGEADSDDAHEGDREVNPEKYRHHIEDTANAAYLGEADSDDAHEADREVNPEKYRHMIDDVSSSGIHGQSGEGDEPIERK